MTTQVQLHPATPGDLPRLVAAADAIFRSPPRPGLSSMGLNYPLLFAPDNAANLLMAVTAQGSLIGHAGFTLRQAVLDGHPSQVACFGAVFTTAAERNQGIATQVFAGAVARARAAGAELGLVSGKRAMYERAGFRPYPACRRYRVQANGASASNGGAVAAGAVSPIAFSPPALPDLMRLHGQEPVRFVRSEAQWRRLAAAGVLFHQPGRIFLIEQDGQPVAYLAVAFDGDPAQGARGGRVLELAGDRQAIADVLPALADQLGLPTLDVVMPPHDRSLEGLACQRGWHIDELSLSCCSQRWVPAPQGTPLPFYGLDYV